MVGIEEKIMHKAREIFDVAGAASQSNGSCLLILGMESTPERNLDEFGHKDGVFLMYGFRIHAAPRLEAIINYIHKKGYSAELMGRYGYPLEGSINLKIEAVRAGIGLRGKNTLVLHPKFGARLRFMAIKTSAPLIDQTTKTYPVETRNPMCKNCSECIKICPSQILEPYRLAEPAKCLSNISPMDSNGRSILCDKCVEVCSAGGKRKRQHLRKKDKAVEPEAEQ
ncbi:MAG: hypothetical protein JW954_00175 [Dehalococcoidaceae bacterium]|nr:hypothetical protein [Dehalococcoidaceae bacterium]